MFKSHTRVGTESGCPGEIHTAYTVLGDAAGMLRSSSGWTLRDAIEFYARDNGNAGGRYKLIRPFERQEDYLRRHGIYM